MSCRVKHALQLGHQPILLLCHQSIQVLCPADLLNVFETFLPQLLLYPNPTDPLNGEAAALLMREPQAYNAKVKGAFWLSQGSPSKATKQALSQGLLILLIEIHC